MEEQKKLAPQEKTGGPGFLKNALRAVKGDNTQQLVEQFTDEMTLVAEGLCDDQARLRGELTELHRTLDRSVQRLESRGEACETELSEYQRDMDARLQDLIRRVTALEIRETERTRQEEQAEAERRKAEKEKKNSHDKNGLLRQITVIAGILSGAAVAIAAMNLIRALLV